MYFDYRELTICHYKLHAQNVLSEWTRHLCDHVMDTELHSARKHTYTGKQTARFCSLRLTLAAFAAMELLSTNFTGIWSRTRETKKKCKWSVYRLKSIWMRSDALATREIIKTKTRQAEVTCRHRCRRILSEWIRFEHKRPLSKWNETVNVRDSIWFSEAKPITMPLWSSKPKKKKCDWIFNIASFRADYLGITSSSAVPNATAKGNESPKRKRIFYVFGVWPCTWASRDCQFDLFTFFSRTFISLEFISFSSMPVYSYRGCAAPWSHLFLLLRVAKITSMNWLMKRNRVSELLYGERGWNGFSANVNRCRSIAHGTNGHLRCATFPFGQSEL